MTATLPQDNMLARMACQTTLAALLERTPAILFASVARVDGHSFAHANSEQRAADPQRCAAIMSSLMGLIESFGREALNSGTLYTSISTEHGSIVMVRIPSERRQHTLCVCADATENLAMTIRAARDTAQTLAQNIDAGP
jgi:predicted regulator of Ras-like GTPase activity (Roadblock/LC7/MglB family)